MSTPRRSPRMAAAGERGSPYPIRSRTPLLRLSPSLSAAPLAPSSPQSPTNSIATAATEMSVRPLQVTLDFADADDGTSGAVETSERATTYQLLVRPIVKSTVGQRDTSGTVLNDVVVTGSSFDEIIQRLWDLYGNRIKGRALRNDANEWAVVVPEIEDWRKLMQFKLKKKVVENTKSDQEWRQWLVKRRGETVMLLLYEYGMAIQRQQEHDVFTAACIQPEHIDRAGATAERSLRDVVTDLQEHWGATFQAEQVVWRMWANHITSNLNRATWEAAISRPPPNYITQLLRPAESHLQQHLTSVSRSGSLALDLVNACISDHRQLHRDIQALTTRTEAVMQNLSSRKAVIEAFLRDLVPPAAHTVADPLSQIDNIQDLEHDE